MGFGLPVKLGWDVVGGLDPVKAAEVSAVTGGGETQRSRGQGRSWMGGGWIRLV